MVRDILIGTGLVWLTLGTGVGLVGRGFARTWWRPIARWTLAVALSLALVNVIRIMRLCELRHMRLDAAFAIMMLGFMPAILGVVAAITSLIGAGFCASLCRRRPGLAADRALGAFWFATLIVVAVETIVRRPTLMFIGIPMYEVGWTSQVDWPAIAAIPFATWAALTLVQRFGIGRAASISEAIARFRRPVAVRIRFRRPTNVSDVRGVGIGIVASALGLSLVHVVPALTELALAAAAECPGWSHYWDSDPCVVRVALDSAATFDAVARRSEVAVEAEAIRRLKRLGARRVVLFAPHILESYGPPDPKERDFRSDANLRDLGKLVAAMRDAGNVVLVLDQTEYVYPATRYVPAELRHAACASCPSGVRVDNAGGVPVLATEFDPEGTPAPYVLWAARFAVRSRKGVWAPAQIDPDRIRGVRTSGGIACPDRWLAPAKARMSDLLAGREIRQRFGRTLDPVAQFKNKIVFLDPLRTDPAQAPRPDWDPVRLTAAVTASLVASSGIASVPGALDVIFSVMFSVLCGCLYLNRSPASALFRAVWLTSLLILLVGVVMTNGYWIDPSAALIGCAAALLFSLSLGFGYVGSNCAPRAARQG